MGNELQQGQMVQKKKATVPYKPSAKPWEYRSDKPMHEMSQNEVKDYMTSLTYNDTTRNVMKKNITGRDLLLCRSPEDIAVKIGIPIEKAEGLFEMLQVEKQKEMFGSKSDKGDDTKKQFDPNANFMGSRSWKNKPLIYWTPYNVKSWFVSEFSRKVSVNVKKKVLDNIDTYILNGHRISNMDDGKVLAATLGLDAKIGKIVYDAMEKRMLSEGTLDEEKKEKEAYRFRKLQWRKYDWIKLSKKKDCIMGYTNEDKIDRAEMPCGHAIAADTMFYYIKSIIEKNKDAVFIICPVPKCETEWDWNTCLRIADLSEAEMMRYNVIRENRKPETVIMKKSCPFCHEFIPRPGEVKQYRVSCNKCKNDWCFGCEQKWQGDGDIMCGNSNCKLVSGINHILQNCETHKVKYIDAQIPIYRACPTCLTPIEHLEKCKHMKCQAKGCKTEFCFICLAVKDPKTYKWPKSCNEGVLPDEKTGKTAHNYLCKFAPRQYFV